MATSNEHTVKAFDAEINTLRGLIAEMGGLAEQALVGAVRALDRSDTGAAADIVARDQEIDRLEVEVERLAVQIIALRAPMANDLRDLIAALKIASVVERVGDYAKNIAKRVPLLSNHRHIEAIPLLLSMAEIATEMVRDALDAFGARDSHKSVAVCARDRMVDDFYNSIFRTLVTHMMENPRSISESAHLLFIAKNIERIGDHATNVAEMVYYAATGEHMDARDRSVPGGSVLAPEVREDDGRQPDTMPPAA